MQTKPFWRHAMFGAAPFAATIIASAAVSHAAEPSASTAASIIGTWRLVKLVNTDPTGKVTYPFGERPLGYFVYDPTGHLSIHIERNPTTPSFASGDDDKGTDAEVRAAYDGYVAYFGTYRVDEKNHFVTHVVEGSLRPSYTGTEQSRPYKLSGDTLIIEVRDKEGNYFYRELHRVR